jgi:hypothetical protein
MFADPSYAAAVTDSDRLVSVSSLPQNVPAVDIRADEDILDEHNNPMAQQLDQMIDASTQEHRQEMLEHMQAVRDNPSAPAQAAQSQNLWFMDDPASGQKLPTGYTTFSTQAVAPGSNLPKVEQQQALSKEEKALLNKLHKEEEEEANHSHGSLRVIEPLSSRKHKAKAPVRKVRDHRAAKPAHNRDATTSDKGVDPAILGLAVNNDRDVASLAREANKKQRPEPPDEVVISLR